MGAPTTGMQAGEQPAADTLLTSFKTISPAERRRHVAVLDYWLSIRGDREFPPLHDLDPLEISDAGPSSMLLELVGGGEDAEVRHLGEELRDYVDADRVIESKRPSVLASIGKKLSIVAISRNFLSFEDEFTVGGETTRCWVTLLPLSASGVWVDYVYALVSTGTISVQAEQPVAKKAPKLEPAPEPIEVAEPEVEEAVAEAEEPVAEVEEAAAEPEEVVAEVEEPAAELQEPVAEIEEPVAEAPEMQDEPEAEAESVPASSASRPGFSKLIDSLAGLGGFYGTHSVKVEPKLPPAAVAPLKAPPVEEEAVAEEPAAEPVEDPVVEASQTEPEIVEAEAFPDEPLELEQVAEEEPLELEQQVEAGEPVVDEAPEPVAQEQTEEPVCAKEGSLQSKLTEVRAEADEARQAKLRANSALYEALGAAYDFALDAEDSPEEYLRLVEKQGLKIQLRSPMKPVVRLAFDGMCDDGTLKQLEAVLDWAFKQDLPRGTLAERIEEAGGIAPILQKAA